jgi:hypothetical protein
MPCNCMHNVKLKTQPKQLLGVSFRAPRLCNNYDGKNIGKEGSILKTSNELLTISILDGVHYDYRDETFLVL